MLERPIVEQSIDHHVIQLLLVMLTSINYCVVSYTDGTINLPCTPLFSIVKGTVRVAHSVNRDRLDPHA